MILMKTTPCALGAGLPFRGIQRGVAPWPSTGSTPCGTVFPLQKDFVFRNKQGEIIAVCPYGSEEHLRVEQVLEILYEADRRRLAKLLDEREQQKQVIESRIEECDKKIFRKVVERSAKRYNMTQVARVLGVHRETLYYWIKKGWIKPKHDYRNYPVFTVLDIESMMKWKNRVKV